MSRSVLGPTATVRDAIAAIESSRRFIVPVVAEDGVLLGIVSDGDIRRAILAGATVESPVAQAMTAQPITGKASDTPEELLHEMLTRGVAALPVVDADGRFAAVVQVTDYARDEPEAIGLDQYWGAIIMAGGEGRRLRPLTADKPKPMIEVGGVPLLERQIRTIVRMGLTRIFISTNYLGHMIEEHFGDGSEFGAEISYLREKEKLGTAGALALLPARPEGPVLVLNGDILTTSDYGKLLSYHMEHGGFLTLAAVEYRVEIPFGVIRAEGPHAVGLEEKPSQRFLCNAGIYVLSPEAVDLIPGVQEFNMTDVIQASMQRGHDVAVFPIHEYWTDIGNPHDLEKAKRVFEKVNDD